MHMRARRALLPTALATAFLAFGAPARATSIDPELVVESVSEDGYYVDSAAQYFKSDADLDRLREALDGRRTAGVLVLPAGTDAGSIITRLLDAPNRRATYVALAGTRLEAASNTFSRATVDRMLARARRSASPSTEVLTFLDLLNPKPPKKTVPLQKGGNLDLPTADDASPADATTAPAAASKPDDSGGGNGLLYGAGGLVVVALGSGGYLLWRRRRRPKLG